MTTRQINEALTLFFMDPMSSPTSQLHGVLYLLRRDVLKCLGVDLRGRSQQCQQALWPAAMAILAGVDLLGKMRAGSDSTNKVGERFRDFIEKCWEVDAEDAEVIYHLRNALLHSFGLYSSTGKGNDKKEYLFSLTATSGLPLITQLPGSRYQLDLLALQLAFEAGVRKYQNEVATNMDMSNRFGQMFPRYGAIHIG